MPTLRQRREDGSYFIDDVVDGERTRDAIRVPGPNGEPVKVYDAETARAYFDAYTATRDRLSADSPATEGDPTLRELRDYYESTYLLAKGTARKTITGYQLHLDKFVTWCARHNIGRVSQLTQEWVQKWAVELAQPISRDTKALSPKSVKLHVTTVRAWLNACVENGKLAAHPIRRWITPRVDETEPNTLSWPELAALAKFTREKAPAWLYHPVYWIMNTGQPPADTADLRWSQVDLEAGTITRLRVKVKALKKFPVNPEAHALLRRLAEARPAAVAGRGRTKGPADDFVFLDWRGQPLNPNRLYQHWTRLIVAGGYARYVTLYDLRHTFATLMAAGDPERGIPPTPLPFLRVLMNHSSILMTARYAHAERADWAMTHFAANLRGLPGVESKRKRTAGGAGKSVKPLNETAQKAQRPKNTRK